MRDPDGYIIEVGQGTTLTYAADVEDRGAQPFGFAQGRPFQQKESWGSLYLVVPAKIGQRSSSEDIFALSSPLSQSDVPRV